jgi:hypothetical protein
VLKGEIAMSTVDASVLRDRAPRACGGG